MLDSDTRRKIDTLRDILVGKIPNPQTQVEQITTGLIYKFMDDMDQESIEMGGKGSFFVGDYEKYAWKNLLDPKLSGVDKVNLYSQAIEDMYLNPSAPQLFRDIFKNAFLPFKDPSTLNMFLKEINEFHYSHSEKLGDAFEYLISIMGSQGDAGQFRTPRHIIDFIVEIIDPQKNETILDPACGTAGFLISSYKHILKTNTGKKLGDKLSAEDKKKVGENVTGYDISPEMIRLSLVNMYLHGFSTPKIDEYDTLSSEDKWNEYFDVILANPPFFSPKGGIQPHSRFGVKSKRAEVLFISYILEHLKPNGRAGIIVPEGIIFKKDKAYKELRKQLIETALVGVISLPVGVFQPYSGVKTSILVLDKKLSKESDSIFFAEVKNDGFSLGAQRNPINENDLPEILETIKKNDFDKKVNCKEIKVSDIKEGNLREHLVAQIVNKNDITFYPLKDVASVSAGNSAPQDQNLFEKGKHPFIRTSDVSNINFGEIDTSRDLLNEKGIEGLKLFPAGSILFPKSGASTLKNYRVMLLRDAYVVSHLSVIKADENKVLDKFLLYLLKNIDAIDYVTDPSYPSLNLETISSINIPLPPIEVQQEIVDELEGFQKIIDGCKQVVENYKPSIDIDSSWETVKLGEVCKFEGGTQPPKSTFIYKEKENYIRLLQIRDYKSDKNKVFIPTKEKHKVCKEEDIMIGRYGPPVFQILRGKSGAYNVALMKCVPNNNLITNEWLYVFLSSAPIQKRIINLSTRVRQSGVRPSDLNELLMPVPPLKVQKDIGKKLEEERLVIESNEKLIEIYTLKIQDRINKVWGED